MSTHDGKGPTDEPDTDKPGSDEDQPASEDPHLAAYRAYAREFGHILKRLRARTGLSQERISYMAGLSSNSYQLYEKGESRPGCPANPRLMTLVALARTFDVPLSELLPKDEGTSD